jgi:hypothetical protein
MAQAHKAANSVALVVWPEGNDDPPTVPAQSATAGLARPTSALIRSSAVGNYPAVDVLVHRWHRRPLPRDPDGEQGKRDTGGHRDDRGGGRGQHRRRRRDQGKVHSHREFTG